MSIASTMTALLVDAAVPAIRLIKLAREGIKLNNASHHEVALLVGRGLGTNRAAGRGPNWNARLGVAW